METDLRLENIFVSLNPNTLNKLDDLLNTKELELSDKSSLDKYILLTNQIQRTPSIEILKKEFPDLYFDNVEILSENEIDDYIRLFISNVKNLAISRKLVNIASQIRTSGINEHIINDLDNITKSDVVSIPYSDIGNSILDVYKQKVNEDGIKTGVNSVNKDTGGLHPGTLTTMLGFTGNFKTTWALNVAYNAIIDGFNVLYLSLEVTKENIYYNMLSRHSLNKEFSKKIEHLDLKRKTLKDEDFKYLEDNIYPDFKNKAKGLFIIDETELENYSFFSLQNKFIEIEKLAIQNTGKGIDLIVIDHAQLLKFDNSMKGIGNETNVVNAYVSFFRQQVLNWCKTGRQIAGLILSQASREGWKDAVRNEGQYKLTALAEANELERASSLVLSVYSSNSLKQIKAAKIQILKNRDGQAWSEPQEVFVDPAYYMFGESSENESTSTNFNMEDLGSLFNMSSDNLSELSTLSEEANINNIDLEI
jgi:replicative DNA helicase